jgi:hypothetical protein
MALPGCPQMKIPSPQGGNSPFGNETTSNGALPAGEAEEV